MGLAENLNLTETEQKLVKKAAKENGVEDFQIEANVGSSKGDNFVAEVKKVIVTDNKSDKVISLILKSTRAESDQLFPITPLFAREILMYKEILPQLLRYQSDANISNPFNDVAKYYGSSIGDGREAILMEDLTVRGFRMWNKRYPMEDDHISLVMTEYAKLHAISLAIAEKDPERYEKWKTQLCDVWEGTINKDSEAVMNMLGRAKANCSDAIKDESLRNWLDECWDSGVMAMNECKEESLLVVTHGDSWCNNMMFCYEADDSSVKNVCLIDWQLAKMGTPLWDVAYFFHVCASTKVLNNYEKYLKLYHKVLSGNLTEFGCDADKIFSYDTLVQKWNKYACIGLFCGLMLGKVMISDSEDIPDNLREKIGADFNKSINDVIVFNPTKQAIYDQKITDLVKYMKNNNFMTKFKLPENSTICIMS